MARSTNALMLDGRALGAAAMIRGGADGAAVISL
jgi:hypothetical protein